MKTAKVAFLIAAVAAGTPAATPACGPNQGPPPAPIPALTPAPLWGRPAAKGPTVFTDVTSDTGVGFRQHQLTDELFAIGAGRAVFDFNDDGCLDLFVVNPGQEAGLSQNTCGAGNNWLAVRSGTQFQPQRDRRQDRIGR